MEDFEDSLLDDPAPRGARVVALGLLARLAVERERLARVAAGETGDEAAAHDVEALHDFRVALRRLRSWQRALRDSLEGSRPRGVRRRLRRIAKESNAGRDAEVFLAWLREAQVKLPVQDRSAARWLIERFERQQREADSSLDGMLTRDFDPVRERLETRLESYRVQAHVRNGMREPTLAAVLSALLREHADDVRARLGALRSPDDDRDVHRARIAGKRLRYLLEPLAPHVDRGPALVSRLKSLQDTLGDLHDAHIWLLILRDMVAELAVEEAGRLARDLTVAKKSKPGRDVSTPGPSRAGFVRLARLAHERAATAYAALQRDWSARGTKRFFRDLERASAMLEERARTGIEIERKYLLTRLPPSMPRAARAQIAQGYLPGTRLVERLRLVQANRSRRFYRTVKVGRGIVRTELEEETTRVVFDAMWPLTMGHRLTKRRHRVPDGDLAWEIDEFSDRELVLAEIELPSPDTEVVFPDWLAPFVEREVTNEAAYANYNLSR